MMKNNQIHKIKKFFLSSDSTLIINELNEDVSIFYLSVIKFIANDYNIKISDKLDAESTNDLFTDNIEISIIKTQKQKEIDSFMLNKTKKIIFTDYKLFKKYKDELLNVNSYNFLQDIKYFLQSEIKILNEHLLSNCLSNPAIITQEINKYLINPEKYFERIESSETINNIQQIRKEISLEKKNKINLKNLFDLIKKEILCKKFNFLIY